MTDQREMKSECMYCKTPCPISILTTGDIMCPDCAKTHKVCMDECRNLVDAQMKTTYAKQALAQTADSQRKRRTKIIPQQAPPPIHKDAFSSPTPGSPIPTNPCAMPQYYVPNYKTPSEFKTQLVRSIEQFANMIHSNAVNKGFWDDTSEMANHNKLLMMHAEISEVVEALRDPSHPRSTKIPDQTAEAEEMADLIIRALDYCARRNINIGEVMLEKHAYNATRPHMHGKKF